MLDIFIKWYTKPIGTVHIGEGIPCKIGNVTKLTAYGEELDLIRKNYPSLTPPDSVVAEWHGDIAKTIAGNWQFLQ